MNVPCIQGPATSLAHEPAEANVMQRPPRNISKDRLVSLPLLLYAYFLMGIAEAAACLIAYLWVFLYNDVELSKVWMVDPKKSIWAVREEVNTEFAPVGNGRRDISGEEQTRIVREVRISQTDTKARLSFVSISSLHFIRVVPFICVVHFICVVPLLIASWNRRDLNCRVHQGCGSDAQTCIIDVELKQAACASEMLTSALLNLIPCSLIHARARCPLST
jgi:hypothetical protein